MSMQNKILQSSHKLRRKLYDEKLKRSGHENKLIRLSITTDDFGDYSDITVINNELVEVEVVGLQGIPINRFRSNLGQPLSLPTTGMHFFDVLPIIVKAPWQVQLEKDDILIKKIQDDRDETKYLYLTLQVTDTTGTFDTALVAREYNTSFYTEELTQEVIDLIETY